MTRGSDDGDALDSADRAGPVDPAGQAESMFRECLQAGAARQAELRATDTPAARLAARWLDLLDDVGFLPEPGAVDPRLPERIGDYRVQALLGSGGMGVVFRAEHVRLGRSVALKVIHRELATNARVRARFEREALAASRLDHPGICTVYEVGCEGDQPFLAMRFVPGRDLAAYLADSRAARKTVVELPGARHGLAAVLQFAADAARALHAAHEAGLVHRDVKPGNLMVTTTGDPVLLDFGLALADDTEGAITMAGDRVGTPTYMAPEQVAGQRADRRADVYALGVVLYECLTGETPFREVHRASLFRAILLGNVPDPRRRHRAIGRDLWTVLQTALAREPDRRYATAGDFAEDLRRVCEHLPILARRPGPLVRARRFAQRNPVVASLMAVLLVVTIAMAWMWGQRGEALAQRERALGSARAVEMALRASDGREGPVPSLANAIAGYEREANVETLSALYATTLRCREEARMEHDGVPGGVMPAAVRFSPEGDQVLTACADGAVMLWDLAGKRVRVMRHRQMVNGAEFSRDGTRILSASMDGTAVVWSRSGDRLLTLPHGPPVKFPGSDWMNPETSHCVLWADWSPDGRCLATGCSDRRVQFWDPATGQRIGEELRHHRGPPMRHAWSRDSRLLASAECDSMFDIGLAPARVIVYRTDAPHDVVATMLCPRAVFDVEFTPDASHLLTGCSDGHVRMHSLVDGRTVTDIEVGGLVCDADLSHDGERILACSANGTVGVWRRTGEPLRRRVFDGLTRVRFAADDRILGSGPGNAVVQLDEELREQWLGVGHSHWCHAIALSPDQRHVFSFSEDKTARLWSVVDPDMPRLLGHCRRVAWLGELADGSICSLGEEGTVRTWGRGGESLRIMPVEVGWDVGATLDRGGQRLAVTGLDSRTRVVDLENGGVLGTFLPPGPSGRGCAPAWLADGQLAIGGFEPTAVTVHSVDGMPAVTWSKPGADIVRVMTTARRRELLIAGGWSRLAIWSLDGTFLHDVATAQTSGFKSLAVSFDESVLAAGGGDRLLRLWQLAKDGAPVELPVSPLRGHDGTVKALAWSPDGQWLASASSDGSVRLWDTRSWQTVAVLRGHDRGELGNQVNAVLFTGDNRWLLTAGDDGAIQAWPTDAAALLAIARKKLARVEAGTPAWPHFARLWGSGDARATAVVGHAIVDTAIACRDDLMLHRLASTIVAPAVTVMPRDLDLAERAIRASFAVRPEPDAARLDTLARLHWWRGHYEQAVIEQRRVAALDPDPDHRATLEQYEKRVREGR